MEAAGTRPGLPWMVAMPSSVQPKRSDDDEVEIGISRVGHLQVGVGEVMNVQGGDSGLI